MILVLVLVAMALVTGVMLAAPGRGGGRLTAPLGVAAAVLALSAGVYAMSGRPSLPSAPASAVARPPAPDLPTITAMLEARTRQTPRDVAAWRLLAFAYERGGRHADAARADAAAEALAPTVADLPGARGEALTEAAGGKVTEEALAAFRRAVALSPTDPRARFYLALADYQAGRREKAKAEWDALIRSAPPDASWLTDVRAMAARYEAG